jgi:hypothetical protein
MSEIKVNKISPRTNCGTVQLGDSGDTITIPSGATITNSGTAAGFGSTGEVSWDTTKKTASFTGVSGVGYFVDTTGGAVTVTLPSSPSAGNVIAVQDYTGTFSSNNLTFNRNGSNINGAASNLIIDKANVAAQLIYVDATEGWRVVFTGSLESLSTTFLAATGGTITEDGNYKVHTFTGPGTFQVTQVGCTGTNDKVDYMVVAGGGSGGGGSGLGGGGGGGGFRESKCSAVSGCWTASPLATCVSLTVAVQSYPIAVGGGGAGVSSGTRGNSGVNSSFSTITSAGGGGGGGGPGSPTMPGISGGSGGGGGENGGTDGTGGTGNTPPVSPAQGKNGGGGDSAPSYYGGGGGGGATVVGQTAGPPSTPGGGGNGGCGATNTITGSPVARAGGGGGTGYGGPGGAPTPGANGIGQSGGGNGTNNTTPAVATAGTANTGGGGGGGVDTSPSEGAGAAGGSGIVIIRYKFQ